MDLVLVTATAASPGHWLTVYIPADFSCLKEITIEKKVTLKVEKKISDEMPDRP